MSNYNILARQENEINRHSPGDILGNVIELFNKSKGIIQGNAVDIGGGKIISTFDSPFFTALVWEELSKVNINELNKYVGNAVDFLVYSQDKGGGWRFFINKREYPPDSDDTAVIAGFLAKKGLLPDSSKVADLLSRNRREDGRYFVWLKERGGTRRNSAVDDIVDLNVYSFLSYVKGRAANCPVSVHEFLGKSPLNRQSTYYDDPVICTWFASKYDREAFSDAESKAKRRIDFLHEYHQLRRLDVHPELLKSISCIYLSTNELANPMFKDNISSIGNKVWLFRHGHKPIGYSCPALNLTVRLINES